MLRRRPMSLDFILTFDPELERILWNRLRQDKMDNRELPPPPPPHVNIPTMKDRFTPAYYTTPSCINVPNNQALHYEIKSSIIQMLPSYYGLSNEDPYKHIDEFLEICSTIRIQHFTTDALRLTLFPFSLKDKAKHWLRSLDGIRITTWEELQKEFLTKFFPIGKTNQYRRAITSFAQQSNESFHETWERFRDLIHKCPHHQVPKWQLCQSFYDGLVEAHRQMIDSSCGGTFMMKSEDEAWNLFETLSENSLHHASSSRLPKDTTCNFVKGSILELSQNHDIRTKLDSLNSKFEKFLAQGPSSLPNPSHPKPIPTQVCSICADPTHFADSCPMGAPDNDWNQHTIWCKPKLLKHSLDPTIPSPTLIIRAGEIILIFLGGTNPLMTSLMGLLSPINSIPMLVHFLFNKHFHNLLYNLLLYLLLLPLKTKC